MIQQEARDGLLEKYLRAYRIFEVSDQRFGWQKSSSAERKNKIQEYVKEGKVVPLEVEGVNRPYYALSIDIDRLGKIEQQLEKNLYPEWQESPIIFYRLWTTYYGEESDWKISLILPIDGRSIRQKLSEDTVIMQCLS